MDAKQLNDGCQYIKNQSSKQSLKNALSKPVLFKKYFLFVFNVQNFVKTKKFKSYLNAMSKPQDNLDRLTLIRRGMGDGPGNHPPST